MADLKALIRLRKHTVDEKRRFLARLYRETENLDRAKTKVEDQMENEKELSVGMKTAEASAYYGRYAEGARSKIKLFEVAISTMEGRIDIAREDMRDAFAELKKIEITDRKRKEREEHTAENACRRGLETKTTRPAPHRTGGGMRAGEGSAIEERQAWSDS